MAEGLGISIKNLNLHWPSNLWFQVVNTIIARGRGEVLPGKRSTEVRGLIGVTLEPAQSLVLGMLHVQVRHFSKIKNFISFIHNIRITWGLAVGRLRELAVPFLKLRRQPRHLPSLHWNMWNCSFWALRRLVIQFVSFVLNNLRNDEGGRPPVDDGWLDAWLRREKAGL